MWRPTQVRSTPAVTVPSPRLERGTYCLGGSRAYVKNDGFSIPYTVDGDERDYFPDFIARVNDCNGDDLLNVIIEVTGKRKKEEPPGIRRLSPI